MNLLLQSWGVYTRLTARWPVIGTIVPFVPVVVLWAIVAQAGFFPRVFFPGPADVVNNPEVIGAYLGQ